MRKFIFLSLFFLTATLGTTSLAKEPPNIHFAQEKITNYYDSGNYYFDVVRIISHAKTCIKNRIKNKIDNNKTLALVLDIDETALALREYNHQMTFGMTQAEFKATVLKANAKAIAETLGLYNFAKSKGMKVFFISGRTEEVREATIKNLTDAGYKNWDGLYLRPNDYPYKTIVPFKLSIRKSLRQNGYTIVGNLGDQKSDLAGDDSDCEFKLPNPYYFVR